MKKIILFLLSLFLIQNLCFAEIVRVVYKSDKTVVIIYPVSQTKKPDETEQKWLNRIFNKAMQGELKDLPYSDIDISELPQKREDRDAWEWNNVAKKIEVNSIKAEQARKEKLIKEKITQIQEQEKREIAITELKKEGKL